MAEQDFELLVGKYLDPEPEAVTVLVECLPEALAEIEAATYTDVENFPIGSSESKKTGVIKQIEMTVSGSSDVVKGPYGFTTEVTLRKYYPGLQSLLEAMQTSRRGRPVIVEKDEDDVAFVIIDTLGNASCIAYEEDSQKVLVNSCDVNSGAEPIAGSEIDALRHGTHIFHESFAAHLATVEEVLDQLHTLMPQKKKPLGLNVHARQGIRGNNQQNTLAVPVLPEGDDVVREAVLVERKYPMLEDFVGFDAEVDKIEQVIAEMQDPDLLRGWAIERRGSVLINGGKDSGATMLVQAICNELGVEPDCPNYQDLLGENVGQSEQLLAKYLEKFRHVESPTVLVLPKLDTFLAGGTTFLRMGMLLENFLKETAYMEHVLVLATRDFSRSFSGGFSELNSFGLEIDLSNPSKDTRRAVIARIIDRYYSQGDVAHMFSSDVLTGAWDADNFAEAAEGIPVGRIDVTVQNLIRSRIHRYALAKRPRALTYGDGVTEVTSDDQIGANDVLQALKSEGQRHN